MNWRAFIYGMGSVMQIWPSSSIRRSFLQKSTKDDAEALAADFQKIGSDFETVLGDLEAARKKAESR